MSSQVDFAIAFGIMIALVFILFGFVYSNANRTVEDINTRELESSGYIFDMIIENCSMVEKYADFSLKDNSGMDGYKNVNISFEFDSLPSQISLYDNFMNKIDFDRVSHGNSVNLNFTYFFNGFEERGFRIFFDSGSIQNASSLVSDLHGAFLSERNVTLLSIDKLGNINYTEFLKYTKHRFSLRIPGVVFGEKPMGSVVVKKRNILVLYDNGTIVPVVGELSVW